MDISEIRKVINANLDDNNSEKLIINILSKDKKLIPTILEILSVERFNNSEIIADMNLELSRTSTFIDMNIPTNKSNKENFNKEFVMSKVGEFYKKYKHRVSHGFNLFK